MRTRDSLVVVTILGLALAAFGQATAVTGRVRILTGDSKAVTTGGVVVWLTPLPGTPRIEPAGRSGAPAPEVVQRNKRFETRLLAVPVGTVVEFPNLDPFFHNVFSLFDGKRFDLGLYEAGATESVRFDKPGVCYLFCNIHSEMSMTIVVVDSPYFVTLDAPGEFRLTGVLPGRYRLGVWAERSSPEALAAASREIDVAREPTVVGTIVLEEAPALGDVHLNKYGQEYDPPVFSGQIYTLP